MLKVSLELGMRCTKVSEFQKIKEMEYSGTVKPLIKATS